MIEIIGTTLKEKSNLETAQIAWREWHRFLPKALRLTSFSTAL